jgi:hypothetical protein
MEYIFILEAHVRVEYAFVLEAHVRVVYALPAARSVGRFSSGFQVWLRFRISRESGVCFARREIPQLDA